MTKRRGDHRVFALGLSVIERLGLRSERRGRPPRAAGTDEWRPAMRRRLLVAAAIFGLWSLGIEARLFHLQVLRHDDLVARAESQQNRSIEAHPKRGEILDRRGRVLAYSVDADTIYAVPTDVDEPTSTAIALCDALDHCDADLLETIKARLGQKRAFAYVQRQVSPAAAQRVAALQLDGVGFLKENRRYYPNKELAGHLLGYVGIDNQGLSGIESTYDREISGRPGKMLIQTDARHRAFSRVAEPSTAGAAIELTIDKYLQHIAERELHAAVEQHQADSGAVVILEPHSGEILAIASVPDFNPNNFASASAEALRNRAVQDVHEPGSTFKIVTASAALEEGVVTRHELFDVSAGVIRIGTRRVPDFHTYGVLSFEDVIVKSSNVGAIRVGLRLGPERLSRYVRRFGFGEALSPDLPSESPGIVHPPASLGDQGVASISMGYQVAVTPLQMAAAASAVANGGELVEPRAVRAILRNGVRDERPRRVIRRAITEATAAELTSIMEAVVERGTARAARIPGYTVAGKTGTTEKIVGGRYSNDPLRVVRRVRPVACARAHHHGGDRHATRRPVHGRRRCGAGVQADRRSSATASGRTADPSPGSTSARVGAEDTPRRIGGSRATNAVGAGADGTGDRRPPRDARPSRAERPPGGRGARPAGREHAGDGRRFRRRPRAGSWCPRRPRWAGHHQSRATSCVPAGRRSVIP